MLEAQRQKEELEAKHQQVELLIAHEEPIAKKFELVKNVRLVLPFNELEVDKYFQHFKRVTQSLK